MPSQAAEQRVGGAVGHAGQQHARAIDGIARGHVHHPQASASRLLAHDRPRAVARRWRQQQHVRERASRSQLHRKSRPWPLPPCSATTSGSAAAPSHCSGT